MDNPNFEIGQDVVILNQESQCYELKPLKSDINGQSSTISKTLTSQTMVNPNFKVGQAMVNQNQESVAIVSQTTERSISNFINSTEYIEKHNSTIDLMNLLKVADDSNTYNEDEMKILLSIVEHCTESSIEPSTEEATEEECSIEPTDDKEDKIIYTFLGQFSIPQDDWDALHVRNQLDDTYAQYFISLLNANHCISCVLKARGPWYSYQLFTLRFSCTNKSCKMQYKVCQIDGPNFKLLKSNGNPDHQRRKVPQVRGINRQIVSKGLTKMLPAKYLMFCERGINNTLLAEGHLQDFISTPTAEKIRTDALQKLDFDKDDIIDILKMKILADTEFKKNGSPSDVFIRRITLDPFIVLMYSNAQLKLIKNVSADEPEMSLHFDATGNLGRHGAKRIYYYAGVVRIKMNPNDADEQARLQPAFEVISGEHDSFNIRIQLEEYMKDYETKYPNRKWPFKYTVTDFSFALLNAICRAWNVMKLTTYINLSYLAASKQISLEDFVDNFDIVTFLQLCCGHFSKTFSKDVSKYFPNMDKENQKILKEIFAEMIDTDDLLTLRTIWINLSTLFRCKYVNDDVQQALKNLVDIMVPNKKAIVENEDEEEDEQSEDTRLPEDTHEYETMYEKSRYYQDFVKVTYKPSFEGEARPQNSFYNIEFSTMFIKKYVSILPLWTSIIVKSRRSSGPVESHFKDSKSRMKHKEPEIGALPLKCGRLCREFEQHTKYITTVSTMKIPRKNNCYKQSNKRKRDTNNDELRAKKFKESDKILSLYKYAPKAKTPKTPKNVQTTGISNTPTSLIRKNQQTPTSTIQSQQSKINPRKQKIDFDLQMDDEHVEEQWFRQRKNHVSHKDKATLKKLQKSNSDTTFRSILEKTPKANNSSNSGTKSRTGLIDHPQTYIKPTRNFVVSRIANALLYKDVYETLFGSSNVDNRLLEYMAALLHSQANKIQFETCETSKIISNSSEKPIPRITKSILLGMLLNALVIINCDKKTFSYVDPTDNGNQIQHFNNFLEFLTTHNESHSKFQISKEGWANTSFDHQLQEPNDDSALFVINYAMQYLDKAKIDAPISIADFRIQLQHTILWKSTSMKGRCVICGLASISKNESTSWVECNNCKRWTHLDCVSDLSDTDISDVSGENVNFFCIICESNAPQNV